MFRSCMLVLLLALAGCSAAPLPAARVNAVSPCVPEEAAYACQIQRYHDVNTP